MRRDKDKHIVFVHWITLQFIQVNEIKEKVRKEEKKEVREMVMKDLIAWEMKLLWKIVAWWEKRNATWSKRKRRAVSIKTALRERT